jgi:hypothetical protein
MNDPEIPALDAELSALFEGERARVLAPTGGKAAAYARLTAKLAHAPLATAASKHVAPHAAAHGGALTAKALPLLCLAFAIGAGAGSAVTAGVLEREPPPVAPATTASVSRPVNPGAPPVAPWPAPTVWDDELPVPAATSSSAIPKSPPPASSAARTLVEERRVLDRAQAALKQGDTSAAIADTEEHRARFPSGQLEAEREAILIQALVVARRDDEARAHAARFRARYPNSVFRGVVDLAVGNQEK